MRTLGHDAINSRMAALAASFATVEQRTAVVSDHQSSPADLAFTVHYTITSETN